MTEKEKIGIQSGEMIHSSCRKDIEEMIDEFFS